MAFVGIDLGTTNSCVATVQNNQVIIIPDEQGNKTIPSIVTYTDEGILVGATAKCKAHMYPTTTIYEAKRLMGQNFENIDVQTFKNHCAYKIVNEKGLVQICGYKGLEMYPEEVLSKVLLMLKNTAERYLGGPVTNVVITVPAYYVGIQRNATIDAAALAGFENVHTINEPTAAALAYQQNNPKKVKRIILIFDFGGGTFDVTIAEMFNKNCRVLATDGDSFLGGTDIDMNIMEYIKNKIKTEKGINITDTRKLKRLKGISEDVKRNLSLVSKYEIDLCGISFDNYCLPITRDFFETLNAQIFNKTMEITLNCVRSADLMLHNIDEIVLVGGSSKIPKVERMLANAFAGALISRTINPDEAVAHGAALHASNLFTNNQEITIEDVLSLSLGIQIDSGRMHFILRKNNPIPCEHTEKFIVTSDKHTINLYQGESFFVAENHYLGQISVDNKLMSRTIDVKFSFDKNGILTVSARSVQNGTEIELRIDMSKHKIDDQELTKLLKRYESTRTYEIQCIQFIERKQKFDFYCENLKQKLTKNSRLLRNITEKIYKYKKIVNKLSLEDAQKIDELQEKLQKMADHKTFFQRLRSQK